MSTGKHATEEFRQVAETGMILRCLVGSGLHGISIDGQDDRDEMGVTEPCLQRLRRHARRGHGSTLDAKKQAERWLERFVLYLGASFPKEQEITS